MSFAKETVKDVLRAGLSWKARGTLNRLRAEADAASSWVYTALLEGVQGTLDSSEKAWVDRIEALRRSVEKSQTPVAMMDFGAGTPSLDLTDAAMSQGRVVTKTAGEFCRTASKPPSWCLLLFKLVRHLKPEACVELGTCLGISSSYLGAAQKVNQRGRVATLEGAPALAALAEQHLQSLGLDNVRVVVGRFQDTLDGVMQSYRPLDFVFIDGHHEEKATLHYFEQVYPALASKAVIVFDDIAWSDGMQRAWRSIEDDPRIQLSVDLSRVGIAVIDRSHNTKKQAVKIPLV
jgi:predicted O-methyltransferase YrrM